MNVNYRKLSHKLNVNYSYKNYIKMKSLFYKIIGSAMEVHRVLGWGLLEGVYQEALSVELKQNGV